MYYDFTLGTICSFLCAILIAFLLLVKAKKIWLKFKYLIPCLGLYQTSFFCSYSAVVTNLVNVIRNYLTYKNKINNGLTILFISFYVIFGLVFNTKGFIGIFPILASSSYAIFCLKSEKVQILRYGLVLNQILWFCHDVFIKAYPSMLVEILMSLIAIYNIIKFSRKRNQNN